MSKRLPKEQEQEVLDTAATRAEARVRGYLAVPAIRAALRTGLPKKEDFEVTTSTGQMVRCK